MISFKAQIVNQATIKKIQFANTEKAHSASVLELNSKNISDYKALRTIGATWERGGSLANDIYSIFQEDRKFHVLDTVKYRFFALIQTQKTVEPLDSDSILAIANIKDNGNGSCELENIQTHPQHAFGAPYRRFKELGKSLLKGIQNLADYKEIEVTPIDEGARKFYKKCNFKNIRNSKAMIFKR